MDGNEINKENFHFYFPVFGFFDGNEIKFCIDPSVEFPEGYIFDIKEDRWLSVCPESLVKLDELVLTHLVNRIGNVSHDLEDK